LGLETAIVSPSFDEGLRRLSFSLGFFAGGSWDAVELDLVDRADGKAGVGALVPERVGPMPFAVASLYLRILAVETLEVKWNTETAWSSGCWLEIDGRQSPKKQNALLMFAWSPAAEVSKSKSADPQLKRLSRAMVNALEKQQWTISAMLVKWMQCLGGDVTMVAAQTAHC
jgi:hypothetical protein